MKKRFTTNDTDILCMTIIDNENGKQYGFAKDIAIVMNELNDKNTKLKEENEQLKQKLRTYSKFANCQKELYLELKEKLSNLEADYVELNDEKEKWKSMTLSSSNENSILWNEISILREQGAEPSDAFKKYLRNILTDYDKFWRKKLEQAKKSGLI